MKIGFITHEFPALTETFVLDQVRGLLDEGHDVQVLASRRGSARLEPIEERRLCSRTHYESEGTGGAASRVMKGVVALLANARRPPRVVRAPPWNMWFRDLRMTLRALATAAPALESGQFDLLHAHFGDIGVKANLLRKILGWRCGLVTSFYGYDLSRTPRGSGRRMYESLFEDGQLMIALSDNFRRRLHGLGCPPEKVVVHHLGVDCRRFKFAPRLLGSDALVRLVSVARLVEKKGIEYGIRAVSELTRRGRRLAYDVIGDGPLRKDLEGLTANLGLASTVRFWGSLSHGAVAEALSTSHILLAPSVTAADGDEEGTPVALMEAMATGLPVVSTWHSGIPEIVHDGESGLLVPERDSDALASRIDELIRNPDRWADMGRRGRAHIETHFNIEKLNGRLVEIYAAAIKMLPTAAIR